MATADKICRKEFFKRGWKRYPKTAKSRRRTSHGITQTGAVLIKHSVFANKPAFLKANKCAKSEKKRRGGAIRFLYHSGLRLFANVAYDLFLGRYFASVFSAWRTLLFPMSGNLQKEFFLSSFLLFTFCCVRKSWGWIRKKFPIEKYPPYFFIRMIADG